MPTYNFLAILKAIPQFLLNYDSTINYKNVNKSTTSPFPTQT